MTTFNAFTGSHSHELQIGKFVFQVRKRHAHWAWRTHIPRIHFFIDPYGKWL